MASPDFFGEPRTPRLVSLLNEIRTGQLQIPRFQRPFVWDDDQRLELLDSVYRGYPIGSILIWRTQQHRTVAHDRLGPAWIPALSSLPVHQYVLDGHQRLATLYAALGPGLEPNDAERDTLRQQIQEDQDRVWPIYFALEVDESKANPFKLRPRGRLPDTWLPLDIVFDSFALGEFKDQLRLNGRPRQLVNRVQRVADTMRDYTLPIIPIVTEQLDQVTISFKRVNSGGTRMSEAHMLSALTWRPDFDLHQLIDDRLQGLREVGWQEVDDEVVINACKQFLRKNIYKEDIEDLAEEIGKDATILDRAVGAIKQAALALDRAVGVRSPRVLPYAYQAVVLATVLEGLAGAVTDGQLVSINRWFWATTLGEYFRGMSNASFVRAREQLGMVLDGRTSPIPQDAVLSPDIVLRFDFRGALSRAIALMLAERSPQDPHLLHADPFDLLAEHGKDALVRLIRPDELPSSARYMAYGPENRFLVHPRSYRALRDRLEDQQDVPSVDFLQGHAVFPVAYQALRDRQYADFLSLRRSHLEMIYQKKVEELRSWHA